MEFKSLLDLRDHFKDEAVCEAYYEKQRWGDKVTCPHCQHNEKIYRTTRGYKCAKCLKKFSVRTGTMFEASNIKLNVWFAAIYVLSAHKKGISSAQLARDIGTTQKTAWFILHRVRAMFTERNVVQNEGTFEIDETYVGGKIGNKHTKKRDEYKLTGKDNKTAVVSIIHKEAKRVSSTVVNQTNVDSIYPLIYARIKQSSTIVSDEHNVYKKLEREFVHKSVHHGANEYVNNGFTTNTVEGFFSLFKRGVIGIYHQISPKHLQAYCDEFSYRYNTRDITDPMRFSSILKHTEGKLSYKTLTRKSN